MISVYEKLDDELGDRKWAINPSPTWPEIIKKGIETFEKEAQSAGKVSSEKDGQDVGNPEHDTEVRKIP